MWSWEIRWVGMNVAWTHTGDVAGGAGPDLVFDGWDDDQMIYVSARAVDSKAGSDGLASARAIIDHEQIGSDLQRQNDGCSLARIEACLEFGPALAHHDVADLEPAR